MGGFVREGRGYSSTQVLLGLFGEFGVWEQGMVSLTAVHLGFFQANEGQADLCHEGQQYSRQNGNCTSIGVKTVKIFALSPRPRGALEILPNLPGPLSPIIPKLLGAQTTNDLML